MKNGENEKTEIRNLPVQLTDAEHQDRALRFTQLFEECEGVRKEKTATAKAFTARIKDFTDSMQRLSQAVATRTEVRAVECVRRKNFEQGVVEVVRLDTGAVVDSTPMDGDDRQEEMAFKGKAGVPPKPPKSPKSPSKRGRQSGSGTR